MDPIQQPEHPRNYAAQQAPRCQHIRYNGQRCAAPALRGQTLCHFHQRAEDPATYEERSLPPFIEDATSLQVVLMWVIRRLRTDGFHLMEELEYKRAALLLYGLQIACSNLKNFDAERARPEAAEGERPQPKLVSVEKQKPAASKSSDEPESLAELLLGFLAKGEDGDPDAPSPRIRSREDYHAAVEQRRLRDGAAHGEESAS